MNYRKNNDNFCFDRMTSRNTFAYQNDDIEWDNENYGWDYYPESTHSTDDRYDNCDKEWTEGNKSTTQCVDRNCHRSCFRPFIPTLPCFNRNCNTNYDCKKGCIYDRADCRRQHSCNCPCHNNTCNHTNTRLYFSGCIEFKNNKRF